MMRNRLRGLICGACLSAVIAATSGSALADTLFGAMEKAYSTNPTLNGARAGLRARDESVPQALSGWRPTVSVNGSLSRTWQDSSGTGFNETASTNGDVRISLSQPVFNGFRTVEGTKAAEARVDAGRQTLLQTEQEVLFSVVQAYMDVYAGRQLVALQRQNVTALRSQLNASQERFNVGEITRTDVEQSRASLAAAQTSLTNFQAQLAGDVAEYLRVVGNEPGKLNYPKLSKLPKTLKLALEKAGETNPRILANAFVEIAAQHDIGVERSALLPQVSLDAEATLSKNLSEDFDANQSATVAASVRIPIYDGGLTYSRVRQAKQLASQQRIAVIEVVRAVRQAVAASWNAYVGLTAIIRDARTQVSAAELALDGVQQEYQAGTRTTIDVLNAQRDLVAARTTLVNAEKNRVVAAYQLLASIGHLTAKDLALSVAIYDPEKNYDRVRNKLFGADVETVE